MRTAIYLRQSSDRHGTELGIERQREDVERLVNSRGWTVVDTFVDNDVSATKRKPRPAFERMMAGVDEGRFDVVVSRHMDRLLRRIAELEAVLERCKVHDVVIVTAADGVDTSTDGGRLVARILASVGQGEVERKSERQKSALTQAASQGRWTGGKRPFGYEADGVTVREAEAALVRQGCTDALAGESQREIARRWAASGIPTTQGNAWTASAVSDVLGNPRVAGLRRHLPNGTAVRRRRPTEGIVGPAQWPAIVDEDTWRATVAVMFPPARQGGRRGPVGLLSGVAVCWACGKTVRIGGGTGDVRKYRCESGHVARKADPLDDYVSAAVLERIAAPGAAIAFADQVVDDTNGLVQEANTLRERQATVAAEFADGVLTAHQLRIVNERLTSRLAEVESAIAAAVSGDAVSELATAEDALARWEAMSVTRRRSVIKELVTPVIHRAGPGRQPFQTDTIELRWRQ